MSLHRRRSWVLSLAIVLIAVQALGLAHRTVHGATPWTGMGAHAPAAAKASPTGHAFAGHDAGSVECRLLDALGQAAPPVAPLILLPLALDSVVLARCQGEFLARWVALFDARGPPARS